MIRHTNRRDFIKTATLALPLIAAGCHSVPKPKASAADFVTIRNRRFERRGRPYSFLGANFYLAAMLGDPGLSGGRKRLVRELDQLRSIGITNLRIMAGSEGSFATGHGRRGILAQPGQWDEGLLRGLDFALAEMAKRDMTSVLYLTNYWEWSGGMAVYVNWATGEPIPNPNQSGIKRTGADHMTYAARFYGLPRAQEFFREHITHLVTRRNTVSGHRYYDDRTIMAWQLSNEPRPGRDNSAAEANLPAFYNWMDETARFIKTLAPRQLVSTGSEGTMGCIGKSDAFLKAHQSPAVDYATLHLWVKNWGWLKEPHLGAQYEQAVSRATRHIEEHIALATQLGRPLVMEEFGINRDNESTDPDSPTTMRDDYYSRMFQCVLNSRQAKGALQAANFWVWSGEGSLEALRQRRAGNSKFREPLDHNGVLHSDQTTLSVIRKYNAQLARLVG
ncbi:MAG: cellulase family glycosylhydrolase [Verrucomicrobia bacterium]|nr:cellulase family glycosylhydrolase [Verrucomicrobiota bacterium]